MPGVQDDAMVANMIDIEPARNPVKPNHWIARPSPKWHAKGV
jgi:hypothetical protein